MGVKITTRPRGGRGKSFDAEIGAVAGDIMRLQKLGAVSSRDLAAFLNSEGVPKRRGGTWSPSVVARMLSRGRRLGFDFIRRTKSEAASTRKYVQRRSREEIAAAERRGFLRMLEHLRPIRVQTGTVITSSQGEIL